MWGCRYEWRRSSSVSHEPKFNFIGTRKTHRKHSKLETEHDNINQNLQGFGGYRPVPNFQNIAGMASRGVARSVCNIYASPRVSERAPNPLRPHFPWFSTGGCGFGKERERLRRALATNSVSRCCTRFSMFVYLSFCFMDKKII